MTFRLLMFLLVALPLRADDRYLPGLYLLFSDAAY